MLKDFLMLAARSITHRKMRSWLTVIGVFIGITAVVALISIGLGLDQTIKQQVAGIFGVDTFVLVPKGSFGPQNHAGANTEEYALDLQYLKSIPGVKVAAAVRQRTYWEATRQSGLGRRLAIRSSLQETTRRN